VTKSWAWARLQDSQRGDATQAGAGLTSPRRSVRISHRERSRTARSNRQAARGGSGQSTGAAGAPAGESLSIQKAQQQAFLDQRERTAQLQQRAEAIQERSARLVGGIQRVAPVVLLIVVALIAYVSWLLFRFYR
jgi:hypothetical protein